VEENIIDDYRKRAEAARQQVNKYKKLADRYSLMRLGVFALMIMAICFAVKLDDFTIIAISFAILIFCFAWLISRQSKFELQKEYFQNLVKVNENEIQSINTYANIYDNGQQFVNDKHFYTSDLDIFGNASLFQLINRASTSSGNKKLADWLTAASQKDQILSRQAAIQELSGKNDWKQEIQAKLLFAAKDDTDQLQKLFTYLHIPLELPGERWLSIYVKIAPFLLTGALVFGYFYRSAWIAAIIMATLNLLILASKGSYISKSSLIANKIDKVLTNYSRVFNSIEMVEWKPGRCSDLAQKLKSGHTSEKIKELAMLINKLNYSLVMIVGLS
jgi:uncharacterized membrane protein YphA (DoxX/SURF4 family)